MPHYDYVCETCEKQFEVFQSMNDKRLTKCPEKGCKGKVRRLIGTGAGLVFKGSGFYITDYRSEGYKAAAKQDSASAASSSSPAPAAPAAAPASAAPPVAAPAKESGKKSKPAQ
ncbi:MAG: FmdB family zinc ribbon protein [Verrucomicrobiota bacterium]